MLTFRKANIDDVDLFFDWANDTVVRSNSYQQEEISYYDHVKWFETQIGNKKNNLYVFLSELNTPIGQVRININEEKKAVIGLMIDPKFRGKGLAKEMIEKASSDFLYSNKSYVILAYIFKSNRSSYNSFINAGYKLLKEEVVMDIESYILYK